LTTSLYRKTAILNILVAGHFGGIPGLNRLQADLVQFADRPILRTTALMSDMGMTGGIAFAALGAAALKQAGHFQAMTQAVAGNTNMTMRQLATMRTGVKKIAEETGADMTQVAGGYMRAINEGFRQSGRSWRTEAAYIVKAASESAISAGANVEDVTNALAISMHDFGYKGRDAIRVMNSLHTAAAEGNMRLEDMAKNFAQVASLAHSTGVSFADAATAMAVLTRTGMSASRAQTQVQGLFIQMLHPSPEAKGQLINLAKQTGIDVVKAFSQSGLQQYGLGGVTHILDDALKKYAKLHNIIGMPTSELSAIVTQRRGIFGILQLLESLQKAKTPSGAHISYEQIMGDVMGAGGFGPTGAITGPMIDPETKRVGSVTGRLFKAMANTQEGQMNILKQHITTLFIDMGNSIQKPVVGALKTIRSYIDDLDKWIKQSGHREMLQSFFRWGLAIGAAATAMRGLVSVYSMAGPILRASPWLALAGAFVFLYTKSDTFRKSLKGVVGLVTGVTTAITTFMNQHTTLANILGGMAVAGLALYGIVKAVRAIANAFTSAKTAASTFKSVVVSAGQIGAGTYQNRGARQAPSGIGRFNPFAGYGAVARGVQTGAFNNRVSPGPTGIGPNTQNLLAIDAEMNALMRQHDALPEGWKGHSRRLKIAQRINELTAERELIDPMLGGGGPSSGGGGGRGRRGRGPRGPSGGGSQAIRDRLRNGAVIQAGNVTVENAVIEAPGSVSPRIDRQTEIAKAKENFPTGNIPELIRPPIVLGPKTSGGKVSDVDDIMQAFGPHIRRIDPGFHADLQRMIEERNAGPGSERVNYNRKLESILFHSMYQGFRRPYDPATGRASPIGMGYDLQHGHDIMATQLRDIETLRKTNPTLARIMEAYPRLADESVGKNLLPALKAMLREQGVIPGFITPQESNTNQAAKATGVPTLAYMRDQLPKDKYDPVASYDRRRAEFNRVAGEDFWLEKRDKYMREAGVDVGPAVKSIRGMNRPEMWKAILAEEGGQGIHDEFLQALTKLRVSSEHMDAAAQLLKENPQFKSALERTYGGVPLKNREAQRVLASSLSTNNALFYDQILATMKRELGQEMPAIVNEAGEKIRIQLAASLSLAIPELEKISLDWRHALMRSVEPGSPTKDGFRFEEVGRKIGMYVVKGFIGTFNGAKTASKEMRNAIMSGLARSSGMAEEEGVIAGRAYGAGFDVGSRETMATGGKVGFFGRLGEHGSKWSNRALMAMMAAQMVQPAVDPSGQSGFSKFMDNPNVSAAMNLAMLPMMFGGMGGGAKGIGLLRRLFSRGGSGKMVSGLIQGGGKAGLLSRLGRGAITAGKGAAGGFGLFEALGIGGEAAGGRRSFGWCYDRRSRNSCCWMGCPCRHRSWDSWCCSLQNQ
jgi:TP901 family phage tail tape measure protein